MTNWKNWLALCLAAVILFSAVAIPVYASEEAVPAAENADVMNSSSSSMSFGAEETPGATPEPAATEPATEETVPPVEETVPAQPTEETEPTLPEETEPEIPDKENDTNYLLDSLVPSAVSEEGIRNDVPLYFQTDYADVPYSDGTVATSGCSMASIAMVAAYLRDEEWSPGDLARRFGNYEASNIQRMESAATVLDLYYEKTYQWSDVVKALQSGRVVIAMVDKRTQFTATQHFLVLTGISGDGRIYVNDSYEPNYTKWELVDGFENGFDPKMITPGFSGAWIFDDYVAPEKVPTRYTDVTLTEEEKYLMAQIIWLESRGESFEGQQAIAEIILNRLVSDKFPDTVRGVIFAEGQFSTTKFLDTAKPGEIQYKAIECAMTEYSVLPIDVYFFGRQARTSKVWGKIGGHIFCYSEY